MLVPQPLEDPLRGVLLLRRSALILLHDTVDDARERVQLRAHRRLAPPVSPGGTEKTSIFATVRGSMPNRRAASHRLKPSTLTRRTRA
jgi:hypothetical protein